MVIVRALPFLGSLKNRPLLWVLVSDRRIVTVFASRTDIGPAQTEDFSSPRSRVDSKRNRRINQDSALGPPDRTARFDGLRAALRSAAISVSFKATGSGFVAFGKSSLSKQAAAFRVTNSLRTPKFRAHRVRSCK